MTIGVLGGGQLGRMLALAGYPLGMRFRFYDHNPEAPAGHVGELVVGEFDDEAKLNAFCNGLDVCTLEFENVPVHTVEFAAARVPTFPGALALATAQDRVLEKQCFLACRIPTTRFEAVDSLQTLVAAAARIGLPAVLKSRRFGYDGKGQAVVRASGDLAAAWKAIGERPAILEEFIPFEREVSIIAVRGRDGACVFYPLTENQHEGGILRISRAPAPATSDAMQREAQGYARCVMEKLDYVGVLAIEFFVRGGKLIANEMAPRVHNSGHWTIEGASVSQFESHLRAIAGLPLVEPVALGASVMVNLIGSAPEIGRMLALPGAHVHHYGKSSRPGRKLGHVTWVGEDRAQVDAAAAALRSML